MAKEYAKTFIVATFVLLVIMALSVMIMSPKDITSPSFTFEEPTLYKNTNLRIGLGEAYVYNYTANNVTLPITFATKPGIGCIGIELKSSQNRTSVCLNKEGRDGAKSDATLFEPAIFMFRPWMLAVNESWSWKITSRIKAGGNIVSQGEVEFRTVRTENASGRIAYVVEVRSLEDNTTITSWIDKEKRIILKENGPGYEIELVNYTFR